MRLTAFIAAALIAAATASPALAERLIVSIDESTRVPLSGSAANVFVGNGSIADAMIIDRRNLVVVGRGYGLTNLLVVDGAGRTILNKQVMVAPADHGRMTLFRGSTANNYACGPTCERTPMPGEPNPGVFDSFNPPYQTYQERARGGSTTGGAAAP
jgi:hypothetical protein